MKQTTKDKFVMGSGLSINETSPEVNIRSTKNIQLKQFK